MHEKIALAQLYVPYLALGQLCVTIVYYSSADNRSSCTYGSRHVLKTGEANQTTFHSREF